jgi:hypothetical protein
MRILVALILSQLCQPVLAADTIQREHERACISESRAYSVGFIRRFCTQSASDHCKEYSCQCCEQDGKWPKAHLCF